LPGYSQTSCCGDLTYLAVNVTFSFRSLESISETLPDIVRICPRRETLRT